jgi:hypothetical protein
MSLSGCIIEPDAGYYRPRPRQVYMPPPQAYAPPSYYQAPPRYYPQPVPSRPLYGPQPLAYLPRGAVQVVLRGERCWFVNGHYYRRHQRGGFIMFAP